MGDEKAIEERICEERDKVKRDYTRRTIAILNGLRERLGPQVTEAVSEMAAEAARAKWAEIARQEGSNTIEDIIRLLWEPLRAKGFEFTVECREDGVQMRCVRCPNYDLAREIEGGPEWLYYLTCATDPHVVAGFNPKIGFRRTKTLMAGDDCCDHFYYYLED